MKVKTLKRGSLIRNVEITSQFYERLYEVLIYLSTPSELSSLKENDPEKFNQLLETMLTLFVTLDEKAEEQSLVEEVELDGEVFKSEDI